MGRPQPANARVTRAAQEPGRGLTVHDRALVQNLLIRQNEAVIDFSDPLTAGQRLSHTERDEAVATLNRFAVEGRLTQAEAAQRAGSARAAVTRGDLAPLFADLPAASDPVWPSAAPSFGDPSLSAMPMPVAGGRVRWAAWRYGVVSISPFVALALFFITGNLVGFSYAWLWFLLIPVAGIVSYGPNWRDHDDRYGRRRYR